MCGLVGFQGLIGDERLPVIAKMMESIAHRGPDASGTELIDNITFGHQRLAIIDIENGKQPMISEDGRFTLMLNGEIYNYLELRQQLLFKGYKFRTFSDTEVLLNLYIEYGTAVVDHLNGMFAIAIYDNVEKTLFIARDHFGVKPLYYYQGDGHFVFGSEIKALLKHPAVKTAVDQDSLYEYLTFQMVLKKHTLFDGILKLEPASYMVVKDSKILEKKVYWSPSYEVDHDKTAEQFNDELLLLLENSLSIQVRSDVPVGAYLSGGLDSSTVAVLAAKSYPGQMKTFTGGFKDSSLYDESHHAKVVSDFISSDHHLIFPDSKDFQDIFEKLVYHMDEPSAGPGIFPQYMVSKLASENVKVVLGGQGGDEMFGGYARYAVAYLEQCIKGAIFETQEEGQHVVTLNSIIPNLSMLKQYVPLIKAQFSNGLFDSMDRRYYQMIDRSPSLSKLYQGDFLAQRNEGQIFDKFSQVFNKIDSPSYFNKMTNYDMKTLLPALLHVEDRVSMAVSLESRVPLLDKRIAELSAKMPPKMKFAGGKTKYMLHKTVRNILPQQIIDRKDKMGFPVPLNEWMAGPLKEYVLDVFSSQKARERGLYKIDALTDHINNAGKFNRDIWGALNLELWHQKFID